MNPSRIMRITNILKLSKRCFHGLSSPAIKKLIPASLPSSITADFEQFVKNVPPYCEEGKILLDFDNEKGIAFIRLDNPKSKNALTGPMMIQLSRITSALEHWRDGKAAVLIGNNNQFCSGGDLKKFMNYLKTPELGYLMSAYMQDLMKRFSELPLLKVAVVQGKTVGGGAELTTACDFRVIQENAEVGFVQGRLGLTTAFGGATRLVKLVGQSCATKMLLSASLLNAQQSLDVKLTDAIFPRHVDAAEWTVNWLEEERLLNFSPDVIQNINRIVSAPNKYDEDESYAVELESLRNLWMGEEHIDAISKNIKHR